MKIIFGQTQKDRQTNQNEVSDFSLPFWTKQKRKFRYKRKLVSDIHSFRKVNSPVIENKYTREQNSCCMKCKFVVAKNIFAILTGGPSWS